MIFPSDHQTQSPWRVVEKSNPKIFPKITRRIVFKVPTVIIAKENKEMKCMLYLIGLVVSNQTLSPVNAIQA